MRTFVTTVGVLLLVGAVARAQPVDAGRLRAGAHRVDITPNARELPVATDSIRDHLFVRAIVVDDGNACAVLVGIDVGAAPNQIVDDAIGRASTATGCPAQNFIVSATHTHSSHTQGLGQGAPIPKTVADAIVEASTTAKKGLAPARVGYGTLRSISTCCYCATFRAFSSFCPRTSSVPSASSPPGSSPSQRYRPR